MVRFYFSRCSVYVLILLWGCFGAPAAAATFAVEGDVIGKTSYYRVRPDENLYRIARDFDVGIVELLAANPGVDPWAPTPSLELTIPTMYVLPPGPREGIVINLSELRLFYFVNDKTVMSFPIGIGRNGWSTPTGTTIIAKKRLDPSWIPPESIRAESPDLPEIIPPGPDNPLGQYAMNLEWEGYAIHGTNRPYGVGKRSSHGCIRLYPEDIEQLFAVAEEGTSVRIIDTPYKLGWLSRELFLEITPNQQQADVIAEYKLPRPLDLPEAYDALLSAANSARINWDAAGQAIARHSGIPTVVATK